MTLADMNSVDEVVRARLALGRWVMSPSIVSRTLSWPIDRAAIALDALYRTDHDLMTLCLSSDCDHCGAQNSTTVYINKLLKAKQAFATCSSCGDSFPVTIDNTRVEYHINSTHRSDEGGKKKTAGVLTTDTRR